MRSLSCSESPCFDTPQKKLENDELLINKPVNQGANQNNKLLELSFNFHEDTLDYMLHDQYKFRARADYLHTVQQDELKPWMREQLVEWMIEVCTAYQSTCHSLAVNLLDRYLSIVKVSANRLQCVGGAAMLVSSKLRDECPLRTATICACADAAFTEDHLKTQEQLLVSQLAWRLQSVTSDELVEQCIGYLDMSGPHLITLREYSLALLDICHVGYEFLNYDPCTQGISCLLLALEMMSYPSLHTVIPRLLARTMIGWDEFTSCQTLIRNKHSSLVAESTNETPLEAAIPVEFENCDSQ
eukprot:Ihof_evm2s962 gene=Ihof_evmTU2s962